jgi:hypothetical protein
MGHVPSSSPTDLRRTPRVISLTVTAVVESAIRTPFNPKITAFLFCIVEGIPHESSNEDYNIKYKGDAAAMPWIICLPFTPRGGLD